MPDAVPVAEKPAVAKGPRPNLDFDIPDVTIDVATGKPATAAGNDRPRDEHGRFIKPQPEGEPAAEPEDGDAATDEIVDDAAAAEDVGAAILAGLNVDDDTLPTFDHDGKFLGGKFLGKYETLDDALLAAKHAQRRINALEFQLSQAGASASAGKVDGTPPPYVYDPHAMTPEKLADIVAKEIGGDGEMTFEQRVEFEENPGKYMAKMLVKGMGTLNKITSTTRAWTEATRKSYGAVFDTAHPRGDAVFRDYQAGKVGPDEIRVLLGLGILARDGALSDEKPVTRRVPVGRAPEARAAVRVVEKPKADPRAEQKQTLREIQEAAYG